MHQLCNIVRDEFIPVSGNHHSNMPASLYIWTKRSANAGPGRVQRCVLFYDSPLVRTGGSSPSIRRAQRSYLVLCFLLILPGSLPAIRLKRWNSRLEINRLPSFHVTNTTQNIAQSFCSVQSHVVGFAATATTNFILCELRVFIPSFESFRYF